MKRPLIYLLAQISLGYVAFALAFGITRLFMVGEIRLGLYLLVYVVPVAAFTAYVHRGELAKPR